MTKNVDILKSVELDFGTIELRSDDILTFQPNEKFITYTLPVLEEMLITFREVTNGIPHLYFCDNTNIKNPNLSDEAKSFMKKHFHEFATHFAMTENSALIRFVAHSFMYLYKPEIKMKLFKTKLEAITWLKSL
tara:strand:+ start:2586 stop:2987 length:402 start_codon:yes stop_codon:yes gene_type:complete